MKAFLVKTQISHLTAIQTKFHTSRHSKYVGGEAAGRGAAARRVAPRRGQGGSVAWHIGTFNENSFHSTIHSAPKEAKMDEKFEPVQLMMPCYHVTILLYS